MTSSDAAPSKAAHSLVWISALLLVAICVFSYYAVLHRLIAIWNSDPDMSHGFIVPIVAVVLLWFRRERRPTMNEVGGWAWFILGASVLLSGAGLRVVGVLYRSSTVEAWSILPFVCGLVICCGGRKGITWAWPSVLFLVFMLPLPNSMGGLLSASLQRLATISSTYCLQVIGVPAVAQGNVIWLTTETVGVAEACNGIRMLTSFCAMAVAACFLLDRPAWQKFVLLLSAPVIAVIANIFRITVTGAAYEWGISDGNSPFVHDLAGWLMMPLAIVILLVELGILSRLLIASDAEAHLPPRSVRLAGVDGNAVAK